MRTARDYVLLLVKGMAMGAADVVPGVSGGTIAFITGIYNELIHSLKNLGPASLRVLYRHGLMEFWRHINGNFLFVVFAGILISLKTFATIISFCLEHYPLQVWGFFSGLIAASIILLSKAQKQWSMQNWIWCLSGIAFVYLVAIARPAQLPGDWWILFFGGFIAICAMILPGISGSFILLLLGLYSVFLDAIKTFDLVALMSFGGGCICGLLVFSRLLSWLLDEYFDPTIAMLIGFLAGSLYVTWPWKYSLEVLIDDHGEEVPLLQANVLPWDFSEITGQDHLLMYVMLFVILGFFLVLLTEYGAAKVKEK